MNRICRDYRVFLTVACGKAGYAKVFGKLLYLLSMLTVTLRRPYRLLSSFNLIDTGSYRHWSFMHWSQVWLKKKITPANTAHAQTAFNSLQASRSGPSMVLSVGVNRVSWDKSCLPSAPQFMMSYAVFTFRLHIIIIMVAYTCTGRAARLRNKLRTRSAAWPKARAPCCSSSWSLI